MSEMQGIGPDGKWKTVAVDADGRILFSGDEAGGGTWEGVSASLTNGTAQTLTVQREGVLIYAYPGASCTVTVQIRRTPTAPWIDWPLGAVTSAQESYSMGYIDAIQVQRTVGSNSCLVGAK